MQGIEEIKDVIGFVKEFAGVIASAKADGKLDIFDAAKALTVLPAAAAAIKGSGSIPAEFADLNGEEKDQLLADFKEAVCLLVEALA
jgi:hypothetical protein